MWQDRRGGKEEKKRLRRLFEGVLIISLVFRRKEKKAHSGHNEREGKRKGGLCARPPNVGGPTLQKGRIRKYRVIRVRKKGGNVLCRNVLTEGKRSERGGMLGWERGRSKVHSGKRGGVRGGGSTRARGKGGICPLNKHPKKKEKKSTPLRKGYHYKGGKKGRNGSARWGRGEGDEVFKKKKEV